MGTTIQLVLLFLCSLAGQSLVYCGQTYCWTRWLDRDNPSGTGDYETLQNFPQSQVCPKPVGIECRTTSGQPYQSTGKHSGYFHETKFSFKLYLYMLYVTEKKLTEVTQSVVIGEIFILIKKYHEHTHTHNKNLM